MTNCKIIYIFLIILCLSCNNDEHNTIAEKIKNHEIIVLGNPDSHVLEQYLNKKSSFRYIVNSMMTLDVIVQDTGAYHCFIMETIENQQQLSYFMLDDVIKFNYIPPYDSLEYDLNLTIEQTKSDSLKWSSKFEKIPYLRQHSKYYQQLVASCNDAQDLSNFCNNSLYFKKTGRHFDERVLTKLIEITQAQLVGTYLRFRRQKIDKIILGWIYSYNSYKILKFKNLYRQKMYYLLYDGINYSSYNFEDWVNDLNKRQSKKYCYSKYLHHLQDENLKFINQNLEDIFNTQQDSCDILMCIDYEYSDSRIFLFNINMDTNNNITITKKYYNKEFLPTTRMSSYYLDF